MSKRTLIVGAGPAGATVARMLADEGHLVDVLDKRDQIAGNCFDEHNENGILVHRYGPHYFRTNSRELLEWLSRFTDWIPGRYYVRAKIGDKLIPLPISLASMTELKERSFTPEKFEAYLESEREKFDPPLNAEQQCLSLMGRELYELIFKNYTRKQWGVDADQLDPSVTARIPLRFNWDERYIEEEFQVMPAAGFTRMFGQMLDHVNINVTTGVDVSPSDLGEKRIHYDRTVYTGPIDRLFDYRFGKLDYRSLKFEYEHHEERFRQPCVQINYPNEFDYTRSVEIKHVTGQQSPSTTICFEYPESEGEPYYPLLTADNKTRYSKYFELAQAEEKGSNPLYLVGRLAEFKYYNTDQVIISARSLASKLLSH